MITAPVILAGIIIVALFDAKGHLDLVLCYGIMINTPPDALESTLYRAASLKLAWPKGFIVGEGRIGHRYTKLDVTLPNEITGARSV